MTETSLTPKQKKILEFILQFQQEHGYTPSQQEIAKNFGFKSLGTVQNYLVRLERHGALRKSWNAKRAIEIAPSHAARHSNPVGTVPLPNLSSVSLEVVGQVAAGHPIEAIESDRSIEVPASMLKTGKHYALKVKGDSMIEDGILDGDYAIVRKQGTANNGQTVVALVDNEATIKRFYKRSKKIELHPANSAYAPMVLESVEGRTQFMFSERDSSGHFRSKKENVFDFKIEGILVGVFRLLPS